MVAILRVAVPMLLPALVLLACATGVPVRSQESETVPSVDLGRYMGTWYEIASFPSWFQRGCHCSMAEYSLKDGYVEVRNSCRKGSPQGERDVAVGKAFPVSGSGNSRLKVQFQWPFKGDYWIIALDDDYRYALVGHPKKSYLWILSRTPHMDEATYARLRQVAQSRGYDVGRLRRTDQSCGG